MVSPYQIQMKRVPILKTSSYASSPSEKGGQIWYSPERWLFPNLPVKFFQNLTLWKHFMHAKWNAQNTMKQWNSETLKSWASTSPRKNLTFFVGVVSRWGKRFVWRNREAVCKPTWNTRPAIDMKKTRSAKGMMPKVIAFNWTIQDQQATTRPWDSNHHENNGWPNDWMIQTLRVQQWWLY